MVAGADSWVYNSEIFCVSSFNQVAAIFHMGGGKIGPTKLAVSHDFHSMKKKNFTKIQQRLYGEERQRDREREGQERQERQQKKATREI